jgi:phosphoribosylformylglycinamidine cyclo-ligase
MAQVVEGLGSENRVADWLYENRDLNFFREISWSNTATALNDLITTGAAPWNYMMFLAVGASSWFQDERRRLAVIEGCKLACLTAKCSYGGGESQTLTDGQVSEKSFVMAGSATGVFHKEWHLIDPARIAAGDSIILVESSGVHDNGISLLRKIAEQLPKGYDTLLSDGTLFGSTILKATHIYAPYMAALLANRIVPHYAVYISGHGWCKLMRANQPFEYEIDTLPREQPIFPFIQIAGPVNIRNMYKTFNMGAGLALYVAPEDEELAINLAGSSGCTAHRGGQVRKSDRKKVSILPVDIRFDESDLQIRC